MQHVREHEHVDMHEGGWSSPTHRRVFRCFTPEQSCESNCERLGPRALGTGRFLPSSYLDQPISGLLNLETDGEPWPVLIDTFCHHMTIYTAVSRHRRVKFKQLASPPGTPSLRDTQPCNHGKTLKMYRGGVIPRCQYIVTGAGMIDQVSG